MLKTVGSSTVCRVARLTTLEVLKTLNVRKGDIMCVSLQAETQGMPAVFFLFFSLFVLFSVSLSHAETKAYTRTEHIFKGLRVGDLRSCLNAVFAEGLSPDVTLFSLPQKRICQVSFSNVLLRLISSDDNQCLDGDNIQDEKLLTVRREIGYSEKLDSVNKESLREPLTGNRYFSKGEQYLITVGVGTPKQLK